MKDTMDTSPQIADIARQLEKHDRKYQNLSGLSLEKTGELLTSTMAAMFPPCAKALDDNLSVEERLVQLQKGFFKIVEGLCAGKDIGCAKLIVEHFLSTLPLISIESHYDAEALLEGDPASQSLEEIILSYPGFFAIVAYRIAHQLYLKKVPLLPRLITEYAHQKTGIDIHPGAVIGRSFFIDHGTGVVVGETTIIGDNVKLYQGVTLGALRVDREQRTKKRHPTIEDNVVIYSGATILGGDTTVGQNTVIGGNVWITRSVPAWSRVMFKPADNEEIVSIRMQSTALNT